MLIIRSMNSHIHSPQRHHGAHGLPWRSLTGRRLRGARTTALWPVCGRIYRLPRLPLAFRVGRCPPHVDHDLPDPLHGIRCRSRPPLERRRDFFLYRSLKRLLCPPLPRTCGRSGLCEAPADGGRSPSSSCRTPAHHWPLLRAARPALHACPLDVALGVGACVPLRC